MADTQPNIATQPTQGSESQKPLLVTIFAWLILLGSLLSIVLALFLGGIGSPILAIWLGIKGIAAIVISFGINNLRRWALYAFAAFVVVDNTIGLLFTPQRGLTLFSVIFLIYFLAIHKKFSR